MAETSDLTVLPKEIDHHKMEEIEVLLEVVDLEEVDLEEEIEAHLEIQEILQSF
jgi:hypothetical protein